MMLMATPAFFYPQIPFYQNYIPCHIPKRPLNHGSSAVCPHSSQCLPNLQASKPTWLDMDRSDVWEKCARSFCEHFLENQTNCEAAVNRNISASFILPRHNFSHQVQIMDPARKPELMKKRKKDRIVLAYCEPCRPIMFAKETHNIYCTEFHLLKFALPASGQSTAKVNSLAKRFP